LALLVATDALFIALHILNVVFSLGPLWSTRLQIDSERGMAETFQYVKTFWIAALLLSFAVRRRHSVFAAWAALFGYVLADDSLMLHERIGRRLAAVLEPSSAVGIPAQAAGEVVVLAIAGCALLGAITIGHRRADSSARQQSWALGQMLVALIIFGVGVDVVHAMVPGGSWFEKTLSVIEDGGEMVVISFIAAYAFSGFPGRPSAQTRASDRLDDRLDIAV